MTGPKPGQKTVLVTGCTPGGIGHGLCLEYHRQGLHVIATARRPEVLVELAEMGMSTVALDVTDAASIKECHDEVAKINGGKLDILVNNAGRTHTHPALDISLPDVRATFETNVFSIMAMVQAFVDQLAAARGLIVNISSLSSITPYLFGSVYCASKAAVSAYSRTLRMELAPLGVRVMVSMTGTVRSNTASQGHRVLPAGSLYAAARHVFEWRLVFSQNADTMDTATFAARLVRDSLRPERPAWLRSLFGRPDWFWYGGLARSAWLGHSIGEWLIDAVSWNTFRMPEIMKLVGEDLAQKKQK
ncbi:putative NADPH-dependent 1-acyldihydroxyacetone phosphate reductase [Rosellinia necatrix]|uniref:Putative NADPH-dependent 1-acyldihydroxyacetone phosphate reductase n=1 Tax=Rosellinia necatrix TaxID=77044 RepID=A0A1W2TIE0_ROSNE|nr:putative NADPH-dependent 1-acyldihydroxyacetone phosphate reductase [Rosellinia necatrix]